MAGDEEAEQMGYLLIEEGLITQEEIEAASKSPDLGSSGLGALLKRAVCVRRSELASFVGTDYQVLEVPNVGQLSISPDTLSLISSAVADQHQVVPLAKAGSILFAVCGSPSPEAARALRQATNLRVKLVQAPPEAVKSLIETKYKGAAAPAPAVARKESGVRSAPAPVPAPASGEKVPAVRVSEEERVVADLYVRLISEWETTYTEARAVQAIKVA